MNKLYYIIIFIVIVTIFCIAGYYYVNESNKYIIENFYEGGFAADVGASAAGVYASGGESISSSATFYPVNLFTGSKNVINSNDEENIQYFTKRINVPKNTGNDIEVRELTSLLSGESDCDSDIIQSCIFDDAPKIVTKRIQLSDPINFTITLHDESIYNFDRDYFQASNVIYIFFENIEPSKLVNPQINVQSKSIEYSSELDSNASINSALLAYAHVVFLTTNTTPVITTMATTTTTTTTSSSNINSKVSNDNSFNGVTWSFDSEKIVTAINDTTLNVFYDMDDNTFSTSNEPIEETQTKREVYIQEIEGGTPPIGLEGIDDEYLKGILIDRIINKGIQEKDYDDEPTGYKYITMDNLMNHRGSKGYDIGNIFFYEPTNLNQYRIRCKNDSSNINFANNNFSSTPIPTTTFVFYTLPEPVPTTTPTPTTTPVPTTPGPTTLSAQEIKERKLLETVTQIQQGNPEDPNTPPCPGFGNKEMCEYVLETNSVTCICNLTENNATSPAEGSNYVVGVAGFVGSRVIEGFTNPNTTMASNNVNIPYGVDYSWGADF